MIKKHYNFILILLIVLGISLRFYNLRYNTQFNWDQENSVAFAAKEILSRHFPLIGARTGVGDMHIGPLYSYLAAIFFLFFRMDPISGAVLSGAISIVTIVSGYFLLKKIYDVSTALHFALIWSVSTYIISLERIPWNVNLLTLASLFTFCGLLLLFKKEMTRGWFFTGLGLFIAINSHFSVVMLLMNVLILSVWKRELINRKILIGAGWVIIGILPLLAFEMRHGYMMSANFIKFLSSSTSQTGNILQRLTFTTSIILNIVGKIILIDAGSFFGYLSSVIFIFLLLQQRRSYIFRIYIEVLFMYIIVYILGFTLYSGSIPEYYFLGLIPLIVVGFSLLISQRENERLNYRIPVILIAILIFINSFIYVNGIDPNGLGNKQKTIEKIKNLSKGIPVSLVYDMEIDWSNGYKYLADYYNLKVLAKEETKNIYWISYPKRRFPGKPDYIFGDITLGIPDTVSKIFSTKDINMFNNLFTMRVPREWSVLQCPYIDYDKYIITPDNADSCNSNLQSSTGIIVINQRNCNLWDNENKTDLKLNSELTFFSINDFITDTMYYPKYITATAFEKERCILFVDLSNKGSPYISEKMKYLLENIKK